ncbi:S1/P1 Nuclease [Pseudovibrio ascidiaceicola]|uniref:S1/P1 Nuclease n=1 Tax=Pseudovibrio ascidiaceicola TaxID=285279 RepID=A0A1I4E169_9HYPH|nr:S1/P1 nuclease [Pseudovibrio ascidiaceicola]SFK98959.1 S1/P1 Nuclease [Pseudovibrio ascidiaceicola]
MKSLISGLALSAMLVTASTTTVFAWGKTGHRVTGLIAEEFLSETAQMKVEEILGTENLVDASTWPDFMRSDTSPFWKNSGPYHYVNTKRGEGYDAANAPEHGDAVTALTDFRATLEDENAPLEDRQLALRFIVHIVGDLHQPMHAGYADDRGGNAVKLEFFWEKTNLHRLWDTDLIEHGGLSYTELSERLLRRLEDQQAEDWKEPDPLVWISESVSYRDGLYPSETNLSYGYVFKHRETLHRRLTQGGVRIAAYLNDIFK